MAGEGTACELLIFDDDARQSSDGSVCHQGTASHIDLKFDVTTLLGESQLKQKSFAEVLRHLTCEQVQAR